MDFNLPSNPPQSQVADAINYLLANLGSTSAQYNSTNGTITQNGVVIGYLYKYLWLKYATSFNGVVGFSDSPTNATYYGLCNKNTNVESTVASNYTWYPATFSTTNFFWYLVTGGRQVTTFIGALSPGSGWVKDAGPAIDLDAIVSGTTNGLLAFNGGQTSNVTINSTIVDTSGGLTLINQTSTTGNVWRIKANGSFVDSNNVAIRNAQVSCYWGNTQLVVISIPVLTLTAQTTNWELEFLLTSSSTSAIWTAGYVINQIGSATVTTQTQAVAASTLVAIGAVTLDLRFSMSVVVATDQWIINAVTLERLK